MAKMYESFLPHHHSLHGHPCVSGVNTYCIKKGAILAPFYYLVSHSLGFNRFLPSLIFSLYPAKLLPLREECHPDTRRDRLAR